MLADMGTKTPVHFTFYQFSELVTTAKNYAQHKRSILFWTAPNAALTYGVGWFKQITFLAQQQLGYDPDIVLDCGDRPDIAHHALRLGVKQLCFHGPLLMLEKLQQIASQLQAQLHGKRPLDEINLSLGANLDPGQNFALNRGYASSTIS
ncbi:MAG TPA: hypothetical protein PKC68_06035 [Alphaproteobacteria bacterium]|jgi:hypothetical protein|nr:hypothetical protein [Alphaproteobacteria bacterium]